MNQPDSVLSPYRVLDLANERGYLCGKILADLGADVIKIEPFGGDPGRGHGPFYHGIKDPELSLYWWAFNTNKRSLVLDIATPQGQATFKKLALTADFVVETFPPGYLDSLSLGYSALSKLNPGLTLVSITPYGQTGPCKDFKATDLTLAAMGGQMAISGDSDRPPVRISIPQSYMHAGVNAAAGCLIALHCRERTGLGQFLDISIQECVARTLGVEFLYWEYSHLLCHRYGPYHPRGSILLRDIWPCKDGSVTLKVLGGPRVREIRHLIEWMKKEGKAGSLADINWNNLGTFASFGSEVEEWHDFIGCFFREHSVAEIMELAFREHIPIMPNSSLADVRRNEQLEARHFWVAVEQPQIGLPVTYPGAPYKLSETPWYLRSAAPSIGDHGLKILEELAPLGGAGRGSLVTVAPPVREDFQALEDIRIADFSWVLAGPLTTKYLADFGAQIVKIESRTRLDNSRTTIPYRDGIEGINRAGTFQLFNAGKRSLTLNLNHPRGREAARRMILWADVVMENFTPGTMEKWGLGYEDLKKIKPDIIMLSASIQGQTGPHHSHPGFGWNLSGAAGFNYLTGWPDREPVSPHIAYTDWVAPVYGAIAILAALDYRRRTGKGQHIDLSQLETGVSFLAASVLDYTTNGHSPMRRGNRSNSAAPHNAYPCRGHERWCTIAVVTEEEWQGLCRVMGNHGWSQEPRFASLSGRKENEDELDCLVAVWTLEHTAEKVMALLQAARVPAGIVQTNHDLLEKDPQLRERDFFHYVAHPELGLALCPREPILMNRTPPQCHRAPLLGEDTEYVCREFLGFSAEEFAELKASGALE